MVAVHRVAADCSAVLGSRWCCGTRCAAWWPLRSNSHSKSV